VPFRQTGGNFHFALKNPPKEREIKERWLELSGSGHFFLREREMHSSPTIPATIATSATVRRDFFLS